MAPRRIRRGVPKAKAKPLAQQQSRLDLSSGSSSSGSSRGSEDDSSSSSDGGCSDEDDPRDYKRGGYHPVMPYQLYNGRYRVLSKLGAGAFSTVWLCADEKSLAADKAEAGPELLAMKVCKSKKSVTEQALDEILLFERMQDGGATSPHVVQMRGHFWHSGPNGRHKCAVFEVMGENLLSLVKHHDYKGLPLNMVRRLARHTLAGLEYIHARGVIHTDVKLENVLVERHDFAELMQEARRAHLAFMEQRSGLAALSKSQKKRMKKKQKNAKAKGDDEADDAGDAAEEVAPEATPIANEPSPANATDGKVEGGADMTEEDRAAANACGRPVPPVRQRDRFKTLHSDKVFAKLADFGNGCQATRKVTDDIQTRQYRSPEIIIGAAWDETADLWSAACMFFELITGDFLFDPRTGKDWNRDEDHLALMIELLGSHPPKEWLTTGRYTREFFANTGKLKHIKSLKMWPLDEVLMQKYSHSEEEAAEMADFLMPMLTWEPAKRQSASDAIKHPWLDKWDEHEEIEDDDDETSREGSDTDVATDVDADEAVAPPSAWVRTAEGVDTAGASKQTSEEVSLADVRLEEHRPPAREVPPEATPEATPEIAPAASPIKSPAKEPLGDPVRDAASALPLSALEPPAAVVQEASPPAVPSSPPRAKAAPASPAKKPAPAPAAAPTPKAAPASVPAPVAAVVPSPAAPQAPSPATASTPAPAPASAPASSSSQAPAQAPEAVSTPAEPAVQEPSPAAVAAAERSAEAEAAVRRAAARGKGVGNASQKAAAAAAAAAVAAAAQTPEDTGVLDDDALVELLLDDGEKKKKKKNKKNGNKK
eukprot:TRINITY_DN53992_c0_g1_i1.p1 TRINITY_DN53992_c0_g1~~TRINITY_DN53992_c0_g1_i1.p1  ORF type:complete len:825 (-),score=224.53 TRINITY_DN53992_c0_g1_i1:88-2562(-)